MGPQSNNQKIMGCFMFRICSHFQRRDRSNWQLVFGFFEIDQKHRAKYKNRAKWCSLDTTINAFFLIKRKISKVLSWWRLSLLFLWLAYARKKRNQSNKGKLLWRLHIFFLFPGAETNKGATLYDQNIFPSPSFNSHVFAILFVLRFRRFATSITYSYLKGHVVMLLS